MSSQTRAACGSYLLVCDRLAEILDAGDFEVEKLAQSGRLVAAADGRGSAWFVRLDGVDAVLRHYYRGGLAARISRDRFLWLGLRRSRAFAEYRLLEWMRAEQLPVPEPLAARVQRRGLLYRCDLLTRTIPATRTLAQRLAAGELSPAHWRRVGETLRRFHRRGVWHADLNARNLLVDDAGAVYLIDFDRCRRRRPGGWAEQNLARLRRSLEKLERRGEFGDGWRADWPQLLQAYRGEGAGQG